MYVLYLNRKKAVRFLALLLFILLVISSLFFNLFGKILYPYPYKQTIEKYAAAYGVDPHLVIAVIREESHFMPHSFSHKGALGLMQLMPETAKEIAGWLGEDFQRIDLNKPDDNIRYGTWYLAALNKEFSGNTILVLAAYNAGSGRVNKWLETPSRDFNSYLIEDIPFTETKEYVLKVFNSYAKYSRYYT